MSPTLRDAPPPTPGPERSEGPDDFLSSTSEAGKAIGTQVPRADFLLVALMLALYLPLIFLGYGSDDDVYLVLDSGRELITHHTYAPSRNPGYFLFEATVGVLSRVGGSVLCNAATLAMGTMALLWFLRVCRELRVPRVRLLGVLFILHPVVWANATSTMDYVWALALLLAGLLLTIRRHYLAAGVVLGLAVALRSTSFIAAGLILTFALAGRREDRGRVAAAGLLAVVLAAAFYVPSFRHAGYTLAFLKPMIGGDELWTPGLRLGRFVYKNLYLWGLPASTILPVLLVLGRRALSDTRRRAVVLGCVAVVAGYEALFLAYPIEIAYLLPMVPAVLVLLGVALADRPMLLKLFAAALASYAAISLNIARPNNPDRATRGTMGLWVEPGFVVRDCRERAALRHCDTYACWKEVAAARRP